MADLTISPDPSAQFQAQAQALAEQQASDARAKTGQYVKGDAQRLAAMSPTAAAAGTAGDTLGATASIGTSKAVVNADAPQLPDPAGASASPATTMRVVKGSEVFAAGGDGVFAALQAASDARQKDTNTAMLVKRGQAAIQLTAKQQEFNDKAKEIHGMEVSATTKLFSSLAGLAASGYLTAKGNRTTTGGGTAGAGGRDSNAPHPSDIKPPTLTSNHSTGSAQNNKKEQERLAAKGTPSAAGATDAKGSNTVNDEGAAKLDKKTRDEQSATGAPGGTPPVPGAAGTTSEARPHADNVEGDNAMFRNMGMNVTGTVDAIHNILDVNAGGQAEQNTAQLAQKQDAIQAQVAQTNVDSAGAWLDSAKDQRKAAQQAIQTHVQMVGDAISNVWK